MKKAFTIVELLVVIVIIGILAAMALPMFKGSHAAQKECMKNISNIYGAIEAYRSNHGVYPPDGTGGTDSLKTALTNAGLVSDASMFKCPLDDSGGNDSYSEFYAKRGDYDDMDAYTLGCPRHKDGTATMAVFLRGQSMQKELAAAQYKASGIPINPGDTLAVGQTVQLADGSEITATSGNVVFMQAFDTGNNTCYGIVKSPGESVTVNSITPGSRFEEVTPAGIAGVKGTEFTATVEQQGSDYTLTAEITEGTVEVITSKGKAKAGAGETLTTSRSSGKIRKGRKQGVDVSALEKQIAAIKAKITEWDEDYRNWPPGWRGNPNHTMVLACLKRLKVLVSEAEGYIEMGKSITGKNASAFSEEYYKRAKTLLNRITGAVDEGKLLTSGDGVYTYLLKHWPGRPGSSGDEGNGDEDGGSDRGSDRDDDDDDDLNLQGRGKGSGGGRGSGGDDD